MRNVLADGSIGELHGKMHELVRNPFRTEFMRRNYDAAISVYDERHRNFIYPSGRRCVGNSWATHFWRGFDGMKANWDSSSEQSPAYAMWRAGQDVAAAIKRYKKEI
jgi:hypothetical protein